MTIRRRCTERNCKNGKKCFEHLRFDVMFRGSGTASRPTSSPSLEWNRQAAGNPVDGGSSRLGTPVHRRNRGRRNPRRPSARRCRPAANCATHPRSSTPTWSAASNRQASQHRGGSEPRWRAQRAPRRTVPDGARGSGPSTSSRPTRNTPKTWRSDDAPRPRNAGGHELGHGADPPLFNRSPFHRFGVRLNKKAETARDRRLTRDEEKRLLDTALQKMNTPEHQNVGALLHDRIIGALELCCRRGEMLMIQNKRVNWDTCQIGIPGATAKDKENRRIPFNPKGGWRDPQTAVRTRTRRLRVRQCQGSHQPNIQTAWETLRLLANGVEPKPGRGSAMESGTARTDRSPLARPASRGRVPLARGRRRHPHIQLMLGHASIQQTQRYLNVTDEEMRRGLEVSWKNEGRPLRLASGS